MAPAIETDRLTKRFGSFTAVHELTMSINAGEIFCFLGSNGAGKSTAIRMLCGLLAPTSGGARVLGIDVGRDPDRVKRNIGYMSQRFSLYEDLSVAQNLRFFGGAYGLHGTELAGRMEWAVDLAGLRGMEGRTTHTLAGGWKQRLALGCALLHRPRVVFLDEPTGGVDPISRQLFWDLIRGLARDGITVMVTTHYMDEAENCDRLALIHGGRLVALGTVDELKSVFAGQAVLDIVTPRYLEAIEAIEREPWALEVSVFGTRLHVVVADAAEGGRLVAEALASRGHAPVTVRSTVPSLEDVFIHYIEATESARGGQLRAAGGSAGGSGPDTAGGGP